MLFSLENSPREQQEQQPPHTHTNKIIISFQLYVHKKLQDDQHKHKSNSYF